MPIIPISDRRSVLGVYGLALALGVSSALLIVWCGCLGEPLVDAPWWIAVVLVVAYGLSEHHAFHIEFRREAISFSLSEVPTAFTLAFLGPLPAIGVRIVGSMLAIYGRKRPAPHKIAFNASLFAFELAVAYTVVHKVLGGGPFDSGRFLVAALVGVALATFLGSILVAAAVSCFEGDLLGHIVAEIRSSVVIWPISAAVAALAVAPALISFEYALLSVLPVVAVWLVLLHYGRLTQRYGDLEALHGFTGVVAGSLQVSDFVPAALEETRRILRADRAVLQVYGESDDSSMMWATGPEIGLQPTGPNDPRFRGVFESGRPAFCALDFTGRIEFHATARGAIVAPLKDDQGVLGLLIIADRGGAAVAFDKIDLERVVTLSDQLSVNLRKALLHSSMEFAAMHDALTGDWNRAAFEQEVTAELEQTHSPEASAVLMLDLDQFKEVNDTLGHHVGDQVLIEFAERVHDLLEPGDMLARFGGDEFAIFAHRTDIAELRDLAECIVSESHVPLTLDGIDVVVPASVGVASITDYDTDASACLRRADIAMYTAKKHHVGFEVYREEIDRRTPERLSLLGDLRHALESGQMDVHFQPKVDIESSTVVGAEALVRWNHPRRGWVAPTDFIGVAEETGLIRVLTDQVIDAAARTVRQWCDLGYDLNIAVNLSTLDLLDELLAERVAHRLDQHGVDPSRLTLEITESSLMVDTPRTMSMIDRLHRLGVKLSLDDFGTGFSSLSYLRRLPVSELKIDRTFVSNLLLDVQDEVIVTSTIDLGHNLGLKVVAEGIESEPVLDRLRTLGCDLGQGFGISRPVDSELFIKWLEATQFLVPACQRVDRMRNERDARVR